MSREIAFAETDAEIAECFAVMHELRPRLETAEFIEAVRRLAEVTGYRLAFLRDGEIACVAGIRIGEWLIQGRYLEIEDFVTRETERSKGYGGELFDWLVAYARTEKCVHLRLLSGTAREHAHRFYRRKGMGLTAYYFSIDL